MSKIIYVLMLQFGTLKMLAYFSDDCRTISSFASLPVTFYKQSNITMVQLRTSTSSFIHGKLRDILSLVQYIYNKSLKSSQCD